VDRHKGLAAPANHPGFVFGGAGADGSQRSLFLLRRASDLSRAESSRGDRKALVHTDAQCGTALGQRFIVVLTSGRAVRGSATGGCPLSVPVERLVATARSVIPSTYARADLAKPSGVDETAATPACRRLSAPATSLPEPRHAWTDGFIECFKAHHPARTLVQRVPAPLLPRLHLQRSCSLYAFMRFCSEPRSHQAYRVNGHTHTETLLADLFTNT
jgi:hypothetical protein